MTDGFRIFTQPALTLGRDETAGCSRCTAQCPQQFKLYLRACFSGRCHPDGSGAAVYARVSTLGKGQGPGLQLREMAEYCARRGWTVGAEAEYVEEGASGTKEKRPALDSLLVDAHRRNFDTVVVWKFDRFDRSVSHLLCALDTFQALGIEFVSLTEGVDTSAPTGKMVFTVLAAPWQSWSDRWLANASAPACATPGPRGKKLGRPPKPLDQKRIQRLRAQGLGWKRIASELGIGVGTVLRLAKSGSKIGEMVF